MSTPSRRGALGRGLAALIPDDVMETAPGAGDARVGRVHTVSLDDISPNPEQPRTRFEQSGLEELAASIRAHGIISPLVVRPAPITGYILISGERRLRAAGLAGLTEVPVVVRDDADNAEVQLELALVENLQREDLDPVEAARGYARLQQDFGYTQEEIARKVGKDRSTVANSLRLLRLPDFALALVRDGQLSTGHAKALLPVQDPKVLRSIIALILERGLSVRATEALVRSRSRAPSSRAKPAPSPALRSVAQELSRHLSTAVELKPKARGKGGRVVIDYYSDDDLQRIVELLRGPE
ncbi:MAG: ParB/RepB/Spo0J family partition protein [Alphaproteobacteria bacterium]|nr:ParB/RepB/Spo0J family partition protein [Alphaproteobacteria bacterium]